MKLVHEGMFSAPMRDSKPHAEADEQADWRDRTNADNGACRRRSQLQPEVNLANKGTSKLLTAECIQNWSETETFVIEICGRNFRSETLHVDTKQVLEEEIHLVMSKHSIVQTEENLNYTRKVMRKEHRNLAFASSKQALKESNVHFEQLQESAEVTTVLQHAQQANLFLVTTFNADTLLLEERNKCFGFVERFEFVHEQQFALQDDWNERVMYQKLCYVVMKHDKPVKVNAKGETHNVNAPFGKKTEFDFEVSLVEETIPMNNNVWNPWIGNGNFGIDAVSQANDIDKTQLSKGHRKQQKRAWKIETTWNLIQEMEEGTQLNENGIQNDTVWLHDLRDNLSVPGTQMCSLKVPATASWRNGSCNGLAAPF